MRHVYSVFIHIVNTSSQCLQIYLMEHQREFRLKSSSGSGLLFYFRVWNWNSAGLIPIEWPHRLGDLGYLVI